jgi:hypothetical protein
MADPQGTVFGDKAVQQIAKTVREVSRRIRNEKPERGRWQFQGGGGGGETIRFEIYDADCENRSAVVRILSSKTSAHNVTGSYTIEGETEVNEAGETVASRFVEAYDKTGCYLNESNKNLRLRMGYATYLYGRPLHDYDPWQAWEVTALCEQQTECEAF